MTLKEAIKRFYKLNKECKDLAFDYHYRVNGLELIAKAKECKQIADWLSDLEQYKNHSAKWIVKLDENAMPIKIYCSGCLSDPGVIYTYNYCPNCGAYMEGEKVK